MVFGSFLQVDFKLIPLLKGLVIGNVTTQLKEEQEFVLDPDWGISAINNGCTKEERIIAYDSYELNPDAQLQIIDEAAEGFQFSRYLELPKSLTRCLQDCNVKGIKIRHKIKFNIQLHNPDGHVSELRANLPVSLYISENLPLNENNDLVDQTPQAGRAALENDLANSAPPLYSEHKLDQLYSDVDQSGYMTPGAAFSTAGTPYTQSRNISSENLANPDTIGAVPGHVSASALSNRLHDLRASDRPVVAGSPSEDHDLRQPRRGDLSRRSSSAQVNGDYFASHNGAESGSYPRHSPHVPMNRTSSYSGSDSISRQSSPEEDRLHASGTATPYFQINHMEDLAKVPSYSTALRTPVPKTRGSIGELPSYGSCMSTSGPSTPAEPPTAHLRNVASPGSPVQIPQLHSGGNRPQAISNSWGHPQNEERRVRMLQLRNQTT